MSINKVSIVNAGIYTNPNTFTRSLSQAYENLGTEINQLADIFTYGVRHPVLEDDLETRWLWSSNLDISGLSSIDFITNGLDGTSVYTYAKLDYPTIDPIFLVYNPDPLNADENRPATIFETFLNVKNYVDSSIVERTSALVNIISNLDIDLTGVEDGTIINSIGEDLAITNWKFASLYGAEEDNVLISPEGHALIDNVSYLGMSAPVVKFDTNHIQLSAVTTPPTGSLVGAARVYYDEDDSSLHLVTHAGVDTVLGGGTGDTGLITFDGVQIIGAGTASSDGLGAGTIELVPDSDLYVNDQYLIIDPTSPNHIHIRAGGAIDESPASLILGGELSGIRVEDGSYNHVTVYSKTVSGDAAHTWEFTEEGYIQTPSRADILDKYDYSSLTGGGNRVSTVTSADGPYTLTNASNIILVDFSASPDSPQITLPDSTETWLKVGYEITIADITGGAATNNIQILAGASDSIVGAPDGVAIDTDYGLLNLKYVGGQMWLMMYGR